MTKPTFSECGGEHDSPSPEFVELREKIAKESAEITADLETLLAGHSAQAIALALSTFLMASLRKDIWPMTDNHQQRVVLLMNLALRFIEAGVNTAVTGDPERLIAQHVEPTRTRYPALADGAESFLRHSENMVEMVEHHHDLGSLPEEAFHK